MMQRRDGVQPATLQDIIDELEEEIASGRKMPLGGGVLVERVRIFDLIDRLRVTSPEATVVSAVVDDERVEELQRSEAEARAQVARLEEEVARLRRETDQRVGEQGVVRVAEERGRAMLAEADENAQRALREAQEQAAERLAQAARVAAQQLEEADTYALQLLQRLEEQISLFLENVRSGMAQLEGKRGIQPEVERYRHEPLASLDADEERDEESDLHADEGEDETAPAEPPGIDREGLTRRFPWLKD